ncbi:MAG: toll/interleukin-1 receptor domain-containing protein [Chloroflexota bacterium]|nr:toll/interleukin-1 receptor domain-containing protein [Chloroflexota bacterium]
MQHVFISYKHEDLDFAENVQSRLERARFKTWMDSHIQAGAEWRAQIDQALKDAFVMVVIMTPEAKASEYITYEWSFAVGMGLKIIPIKLKAMSLHPRLSAFQFLDFTASIRPWEKLLAEIAEAAKRSASPSGASGVVSFIEQAKAAMNSTNASERRDAIATLGQANSSAAREALLEALAHPITDVRQQAALILGVTQNRAAIPRLIELLHDGTHEVRAAAIAALEATQDARVLPALLAALAQANTLEKLLIVKAFAPLGDASVAPTLLTLYYQQADVELRKCIISVLGALKVPVAIPVMKDALEGSEQDIAISAAYALLQLELKEAIDVLTNALLFLSRARCEMVVKKLASSKVERLVLRLDDIYQEHLAAPTTRAEREKNANVRRRAIWILRMLADKNSIPTLIQSMDDEDPVVQQETVIAFKAIQDERALPALMTILRWRSEDYDEKTLLCAVRALRQLGNASILPQLKSVLDEMLDKHTEIAVQVIDTFAHFGDYQTIEYFRKIMSAIQQKDAYTSEKKQELIEAFEQAMRKIRLADGRTG